MHQDQADPRRFVQIIGDKGQSFEKGSDKYYSCRIYFKEGQSLTYVGKADLAKSLFSDDKNDRTQKARIGYLPA